MLIRFLSIVILCITVSAKDKVDAELPDLSGNYYMPIPGNDNQYIFNVDWSHTFNRYLVTVTGQPLGWATARLNFINDTVVDLVCDNGIVIQGIISYPTDLPNICWPTFQTFSCWKRLLSNVTRIHVINM